LKTGLSSADAVDAKVATRRAGSAMPRMAEIDRKDQEGGRRKRGEERVEVEGRKRRFNISLSLIYLFTVLPRMHMPISHAYPSKSAWPDAESASYGCNVISLASFPSEPNHLPQIRRPGILTLQSGLQVLFSVVSSTPDLALAPDRMLAQAVEA